MVVTHEAHLASWANWVVFLHDGRSIDQTGAPAGPEFCSALVPSPVVSGGGSHGDAAGLVQVDGTEPDAARTALAAVGDRFGAVEVVGHTWALGLPTVATASGWLLAGPGAPVVLAPGRGLSRAGDDRPDLDVRAGSRNRRR